MQNLEDLEAIGSGGSKFLVENVIFGIVDPDLPINYATFMGLWWRLLLSVFGRKKLVPFWAKIWRLWGIIRVLTLNATFLTTKGTSLRDLSYRAIARKNPSTGLTCAWILEKKVYRRKAQQRYISPIFPEAANGLICTKFGLGGPLADVIHCAEFCGNRLRGCDSV